MTPYSPPYSPNSATAAAQQRAQYNFPSLSATYLTRGLNTTQPIGAAYFVRKWSRLNIYRTLQPPTADRI